MTSQKPQPFTQWCQAVASSGPRKNQRTPAAAMLGTKGTTPAYSSPLMNLAEIRPGRAVMTPMTEPPKTQKKGTLPSTESPDPGAQDDVGLAHGLAPGEQGPDGADPPDNRGSHGDADEAVAQRQHPVEHR